MASSGRNKEDLCVSHHEYIRDVPASTSAFNIGFALGVNPGDPITFPWLSSIAARFESYRFKKLIFRYVTEAPTSERGYVILVADYDPSDPAPLDKTTAFQFQSSVRGAPWETFVHSSTAQNLSKRSSYFVRNSVLPANQDVQLYDTCKLYCIVGSNIGPASLGELWVEYEVELMTPQISNIGFTDLDVRITSGGSPTPADPFGLPTLAFSGVSFLTQSGTQYTSLAAARFFLMVESNGVGITSLGVTASLGASVVEAFPLNINVGATKATRGYIWTTPVGGRFEVTAVATSITNSLLYLTTWNVA